MNPTSGRGLRRDLWASLLGATIAVVLLAAACSGGDSAAPQAPSQQAESAEPPAPIVLVPEPATEVTVLTPELCSAVQQWADAAPTVAQQVFDNMVAGVDTTALQEASDAVTLLDSSGDVGAFVAGWTLVMRQRQGFITAIGGPSVDFETDRALYDIELLEPVQLLDSASIADRINTECGFVVPVAG